MGHIKSSARILVHYTVETNLPILMLQTGPGAILFCGAGLPNDSCKDFQCRETLRDVGCMQLGVTSKEQILRGASEETAQSLITKLAIGAESLFD